MKLILLLATFGISILVGLSHILLCPGGVCPTPTSGVTATIVKTTEVVITNTAEATATEVILTSTPQPTQTATSVVWTLPPPFTPTSTIPQQITPTNGRPQKTKNSPVVPSQPKGLPGLGCSGENCQPKVQKETEWDWNDPDVPYALLAVFIIGLIAFVAVWAAEWRRKN